MARISGKDAIRKAVKTYGGSGVGFFALKNDGDKATVRFMHEDDKDLDLYVVHKVDVEGKATYIECLQDDGCPLCAAGNTPSLKVFFTMYDPAEDKMVVWDRGPGIIDQMLGFIDKYGYLNNRTYEIVRHGKANDTKTTYQLFPEDKSDPVDAAGKPLEKRPDVLGRVVQVLDKAKMAEIAADLGSTAERREKSATSKRGPGF